MEIPTYIAKNKNPKKIACSIPTLLSFSTRNRVSNPRASTETVLKVLGLLLIQDLGFPEFQEIMGLYFSCPTNDSGDFDPHFDSDNVKTMLRSISFTSRDLKSSVSKRILFEGSLSFNGRELETKLLFRDFINPDSETTETYDSPMRFKKKEIDDELRNSEKFPGEEELTDLGNKHHQAALRLQKVYKSFRTRRQLADCAVIVEQKWWKLLDFAELKRSSISFFDIDKPETAISRWSRARTRAAKVGKGLSKDEKARQLALQHWLEAIDPRHRYGHNLQFYYAAWLHCDSRQPFFYWLDIGEGKEVNLERCSRSKLLQQCIKYLGPTEREGYEVVIEKGRLLYKQSGQVLDTTGSTKDAKWIFVLSVSKTLYVGLKEKGKFQHSSFLAGGATLSAGRLVVDNGVLKAIWPHSGHYLPTEENFEEFMLFLENHSVDLTDVQKSPAEEDEEEHIKKLNSISNSNYPKDEEISEYLDAESDETTINLEDKPVKPRSNLSKRLLRSNLTNLELPNTHKSHEIYRNLSDQTTDSPSEDGYETAEEGFISEEEFMYPKSNLFGEDGEDSVPKEKILKRIDSHKGMKSYQLAQQLSSRWTTGAGARISCMRDYPSELQFRVLEEANLSPRKKSCGNGSPNVKNGICFRRSLLAEEED